MRFYRRWVSDSSGRSSRLQAGGTLASSQAKYATQSEHLPRALIMGVSIVTVVYVAVSVVFLYLVPPDRIASDDTAFAALAGEALLGRAGGVCFTFIVIVSVAGSLAAVLMAFPRVYYAMARDGLFFASVAAVDPRRGTPTRSIAIQAVLGSALALSGTFDEILNYFMVPTMVFVALTVGAVFLLRRSSASAPALRTPGFPISPLLFLIPIVALIAMRILRDPVANVDRFVNPSCRSSRVPIGNGAAPVHR